MRKARLALILAVAFVAAFYILTPRMAVDGLAGAIEARDTVEIDERVDFQRLRDGLKAQVQAAVADRTSAGADTDDPLQALGTGLAMMLADGMIDALVTPGSLAAMSRGMGPGDGSGAGEPFEGARISRESLDRFSATVSEGDGEIRWVFHREGLGWILTNIVVDEELLTVGGM